MIRKILTAIGLLPDPRLCLRAVDVINVNVGDVLYDISTVEIQPPNLPDLREKASNLGWQGNEDYDEIKKYLDEQGVGFAYDAFNGWKIFEPKSSQ